MNVFNWDINSSACDVNKKRKSIFPNQTSILLVTKSALSIAHLIIKKKKTN